jgi:hypothetical protein
MAKLGVKLVNLKIRGTKLSQSDISLSQQQIDKAAQVYDEMIIAITRPVEQLLHSFK